MNIKRTTKVRCRLRVLMAEKDIKMVDVSEKTGIAMSTLSKLVNNAAKGIHLETLQKLYEKFGWTVGEIFTNEK